MIYPASLKGYKCPYISLITFIGVSFFGNQTKKNQKTAAEKARRKQDRC